MSQISRFWRRHSGSGAASCEPSVREPADRLIPPTVPIRAPQDRTAELSDPPHPRDYEAHLAHVTPPIRWCGSLADIHLA